ncbi:MAG: Imm40 family immunity protein [Desulfobacteraceae bacterium]|nr:Imm40 family immunity protein [Desulfobacteraceae bacterium]
MDVIWAEKIDQILSVGRTLENVGVRNWALTREQVLIALVQLEAEGIAILGGDVYEMQRGLLQPNYDNWYCNRKQDELKSIFVSRSIANARDYIANYRNAGCLFAIIPYR